MEITTAELETQIEQWQNDKNQTLARINYLEGAIQSYRVLIAQIENGAGADMPAPGNEQEQGNGDTDAHQSEIESEAG